MSDPGWFGWHRSCQRENDKNEHAFGSELSIGATLQNWDADEKQTIPWEFSFQIKPEADRNNVTVTVSGPAAEPSQFAGLQCYAYGAGRRMARSLRLQRRDLQDSIHTLFTDDLTLPNAAEWLLELDHAAKIPHEEQNAAIEQFQLVKDMLIAVLPDVEDIRVKVGSKGSEPQVHIEYKTPYAWVSADQLSFGYQTIIAWLVDLTRRLVIRYPNSKSPIAEPAIVLLDEIDLHLHPKWQRKIMDYLSERFTNTQFIVTAHSPLIVQANPDAKLILLKNNGDHVCANQDLDIVKTWRIDQILMSDIFRLDSARPPRQALAVEERSQLLEKAELTPEDKTRIEELNRVIHETPVGESQSDREAEEIIRQAAEYFNRK
jgi:hypothetical protein